MNFANGSSPGILSFCAGIILAFAIGMGSHAEQPLPDVSRLQSSPILRHLKPNPVPAPAITPAEKTVAQMFVPEGFRAEVIADDSRVQQPVAMAFDDRGRLWVAEAMSYPSKRPDGKGLDRLVIFEDRGGDGTFATRKVFAEGLNLVSGFEVGYGGVFVGAAPQLLFIPDRNHDDIPDGPPEVLLDGFGYQDTHECLNSFMWGPDGWLYGNQGVFNLAHIGKPGSSETNRVELRAGLWRYHPVRREFEVFAHGGSNPWGLDYDEHGQMFMTHCRSFWGRGCTTHVVQGGHYWNQANANYAPFIIPNPPEDFPDFRNYLLASARYDHGAGGAGKPGSDAIYGGHAHVGTMIYLGDNWPDEFRGHLFTHNLHGHQINQQVNRRLGSGFDTVHAGRDQFFCSDPKYVAVDLQYGPDGAVYIIDWYDQQHCHNPDIDRWERDSGRIYRLEYAATFKPAKVDLSAQSDADLVKLLGHKNDWYARTAQRLLHERVQERTTDPKIIATLTATTLSAGELPHRLHALWTLYAVGGLTPATAQKALQNKEEYIRAWTIQLCTDEKKTPPALLKEFVRLANSDPSPVVRLYLASAIQRVPDTTAWELIAALNARAEDRDDRNLPLMIWFGLAQRMPGRMDTAFAVASSTRLPQLADYTYWFAARTSAEGLDRVMSSLSQVGDSDLRRRLAGIELAMTARPQTAAPPSWKQISTRLYGSGDEVVKRQAERLAASFGDASMFPRLRDQLANSSADPGARQHAWSVLSRASDAASVPVFIGLLDDPKFRAGTISLLSRFNFAGIPDALLNRFEKFSPADRSAALNTLTSRAAFAVPLLDAVASGRLKRDSLTAYHIRALTELHDPVIDSRVLANWGRIQQTRTEMREKIERLDKTFKEAPLWAYNAAAGKQHFLKLCSVCHRIGNDGVRLGPELTGAGKNGIRYFLENIIDPDAVIGADFRMTTVETRDGDVISGIIAGETPGAVTLRTAAGERVLSSANILKRTTSEKSLMPEGLLESLNEREQIELLKFLTTN